MTLPETEYSEYFDDLRRNRVATSLHKYGSAKVNFGRRIVDALGTLELCLKKYRETHNTEYLCDLANYAMFEFMYPRFDDAYFHATESRQSAGIVGMSIREMEACKSESC